jgi:glycerophosphoryl diester phosphodiesterase
VDIPNGINALNIKNLNIVGGTLKRNEMTDAEVKEWQRKVDNAIDFPGGVKIGGTVRGSIAHGGTVKLPVRGLCAHQGDLQCFPGNTAEALVSAAKKGAAMVEFDVQRCKTGEFVLMHDSTIENLTTGTGRIREHSLEELKSFTIKRFKENGYRIPTFDEALDVIPDGGILINVHCYAGRAAMGDIARKLKERGRLHQAMVCSGLKDIAEGRKAIPEITANNIQRPGPRNRDWTDAECMKFVTDSEKHRCQYLQLSRPWARKYSDAAHAAGVKVIHFHCENPKELKDMFDRGIDFVMTNHLEPMNRKFSELGLSKWDGK